jgi:hypothetical protein
MRERSLERVRSRFRCQKPFHLNNPSGLVLYEDSIMLALPKASARGTTGASAGW